MSRYKVVELTLFAVLLCLVGTALTQEPPPAPELVNTGYGLIGDTLFGGSLFLNGFVQGHSARLNIMPEIVVPGAEYKFFRTPYGAAEPDLVTTWLPMDSADFDGGGDGDVFLFSAGVKFAGDSSYSEVPLWLMHDCYIPNRVEVETPAYGDDDPVPYIELNWSRGTDSASGIYKYYIYRALYEYSLGYIAPGDTPRDSLFDDGSPGYIWRDYFVSPGDVYYYVIVPVDKAGWVRRTSNFIIRGRADEAPIEFPPCSFLEELPRYHSGAGITVNIDHGLCGGSPHYEYQYRKTIVLRDAMGEPTIDTTTSEFSSWTMNDFYYWDTEVCSTYAFSARVRVIGGYTHGWTDLTSFRIMSTNDDVPTDCPSYMSARSLGEDGIRVDFTHHPENDCGSGTMGYYLYRATNDEWADLIAAGWEDAMDDYLIHEFHVDYVRFDWVFQDDGPTDTLIDLVNRECYYYLVVPYDSAGNVTWFECPWIGGQFDTAFVDKGVGAPWAVSLDFPEYSSDSINVRFIDTTFCDAESVQIQWANTFDFEVGMNLIGPIDIMTTVVDPGFYRYDNLGSAACTDWDTLGFTLYDLHENIYFFRARFYDANGNISDWSTPTLSSTIDNTPPTTANVDYIQSFATGVDEVEIEVTWNPGLIHDAGSGVESVKIYRSNAVGVLGSVVATVTPTDNHYIDTTPDLMNNWHDNVYTIVPVDNLGQANYDGVQGYFPVISGLDDSLYFHPPLCPVVEEIVVSHYLDSFTVVWSDPGPGSSCNRYMLRHSASTLGLWSPDPLLRKEIDLGTTSTYRATFPIEDLLGGSRHYFTIYARDTETNSNQSGWSEVLEFTLPEILRTTHTYHLVAGWNFISLPVLPDNANRNVLFPGNLDVYEWDHASGMSLPIYFLEPGHAYWVLIPASADFNVTGIAVPRVDREMTGPGWWSVGAPHDTLGAMGYTFTTTSLLYAYDAPAGAYNITDSLIPGGGYWLLAWDEGDFVSEAGMSFRKLSPFVNELDWAFTVVAGDAMLEIAASAYARAGLDALDIPLPPEPPDRDVGAYIAGENGFRYIRSVRPDCEWTIVAPGETILSWDSKALPEREVTLICNGTTIDMHETSSAAIFGAAKIIVGGDLPTQFALEPVRPNPFNPTCEIPFALPENSRVTISIYDLSGRCVKTVASSDYSAGEHSVFWFGIDNLGREMPGGIYFCRMTAGSFAETRRMLLLK